MEPSAAMPLVSVIIPTYKRANLLPRALTSVLAQTYTRLEVIVVDDNLPDSSERAVTHEALAPFLQDPRVRLVETPGAQGGGTARNIGMKACSGEYIVFLDDDDCFLPEKVEKQLAFTIQNDLDLSYQDVQWVNEAGKVVETRRLNRVKEFTRDGLLRAHLQHCIGPTSIYMVRRKAALGTAGFGEVRRGQDFIFFLRCIEAGLKIGYMPGVYVRQYLHKGERISVGSTLIEAQTELYQTIQLYAPILTRKERRYIDFRYNCVCAFASARSGDVKTAIPYALKALWKSPVDCAREAGRFFCGGRREA